MTVIHNDALSSSKRQQLVRYAFTLGKVAPNLRVEEAETLLMLSRAVRAEERDKNPGYTERLIGLADRAMHIVRPYGLSVTYSFHLTIHTANGDVIPVPTC